MFYWLIGNALLIYYVIVNLRLNIPRFDVCWSFGVVGLEWYPCCRLKHNWSVYVECGGLGVNDRLKWGIYFSWGLLQNEFAFSAKGLDVVLLVRNEHWVI